MTNQPIGQAVEVEINPAPFPGQPKATPRVGGSNVVFQVFTSDPAELFRPNQAIASNGTRYAYWKIEDHPRHIPEWDDPGIKGEVLAAWKIHEARSIAKARAEELAKLVRNAESQDIEQSSWKTKPSPGKKAAACSPCKPRSISPG